MIFVEDVLKMIESQYEPTDAFGGLLADDWHQSFLRSVGRQISSERALSTEQSKTIIRLASKVSKHLVAAGLVSQQAIDNLIKYPTHRRTVYTSTKTPREVRFLGGQFIAFRFKYNEIILKDFYEMRRVFGSHFAQFISQYRLWIMPVTLDNLWHIREMISIHRFQMDTEVRDYLMLVQCSRNKTSSFAYDDEGEQIVANVCDNDLLAGWIKHVAGGEWL